MNLPAATYLPQAEPFVLVTTLLAASPEETVTTFTIPENHVLVADGFLTESGLVENMAQSAAAGMGYLNREDAAPKTGFIGALKNLVVQQLPPVNATIQTRVSFRHQVMNASVVFAEVFLEEKSIASCELKIFVQEY